MTMPTSERNQNRRDEHLTDAELNDLVDGTLAGRDLERAQAHIASCQECDERFQTLLATVSALRQAPGVMPRRTFQLTPEQAKLPEKQPSWIDRFAERILPGVPAIKAATIAVALLLVSITAFDVLTNQSGQDDTSPQTSVQREPDVPAPAPDDAQLAPTEMPMLGESNESISDAGESDTAIQESETGGDAESASDAAGESFTSSAMQEAPAAPAAAVEQPTVAASPTPEPTVTPTSTATPTLTATATATATPASSSDGWSAGFTLSWWRIAELGLLMILVWLLVSWIGRSRVESLDD
jgi:hypothetical protein